MKEGGNILHQGGQNRHDFFCLSLQRAPSTITDILIVDIIVAKSELYVVVLLWGRGDHTMQTHKKQLDEGGGVYY